MTHYMRLNPEPFDKIASGRKTIELRLYDEKRKLVKPNDEIIFTHIQNPCRSISVIVDSVITAASFESLFKHISLVDCGYDEKEITGSNHLDMSQYYSEEKQRQFGVVGIKFSINTKRSLDDIHVPYDETVIKSYIFDQSMELRDKFCEENGYDGNEDIRKFLYRYYDRTIELEEYFPLKTWWDSTRYSMIYYFCGMTAFNTICHYSTVFDGVDEDGEWYEAL